MPREAFICCSYQMAALNWAPGGGAAKAEAADAPGCSAEAIDVASALLLNP
jgi:hypothetical protein